jgi:hypothetical protein
MDFVWAITRWNSGLMSGLISYGSDMFLSFLSPFHISLESFIA